jgi:hypothetical protein
MENKMSKATPGPWFAGQIESEGGYDCLTAAISVGPKDFELILLDGRNYGQNNCKPLKPEIRERMEADANLLAAAPDMLEALQSIAQFFNDEGFDLSDTPMELVYKAIEKATK